jgi:hypothetical protein
VANPGGNPGEPRQIPAGIPAGGSYRGFGSQTNPGRARWELIGVPAKPGKSPALLAFKKKAAERISAIGRASRFITYIRRIALTALAEHKERGTSRPSNRALLKLQFVVERRTSRWREAKRNSQWREEPAGEETNQPVKRRTSR